MHQQQPIKSSVWTRTARHLQSRNMLLPAEVCCAGVVIKEWKAVAVACAVDDAVSTL